MAKKKKNRGRQQHHHPQVRRPQHAAANAAAASRSGPSPSAAPPASGMSSTAASGVASLPVPDWGILAVFTATTFISALLLFSIQPMFAKMVLPVLGGAPSVWAVAVCFFQGALLAGYCYAHLLIRNLPARTSGIVHLAVCALALIALPIGLPTSLGEPPAGEPYLWQLGLFAVGVGLPFFAVSANAPLLQAWFSETGHPQSSDPYFLYGASNLGSMIALLGYPFILEPLFGLKALSLVWTGGYVVLIAFLVACFLLVRITAGQPERRAPIQRAEPSMFSPIDGPLGKLGWLAPALIPAALLALYWTRGPAHFSDASSLFGFALLLVPIAFLAWRMQTTLGSSSMASSPEIDATDPTWARRAWWVILAMVPSSLLTAFTTHVTTDVASAPLLWVIPLALYLLTFVFVFRDRPIILLPAGILVALGGYALLKLLVGWFGLEPQQWGLLAGTAVLCGAFIYTYGGTVYTNAEVRSTTWMLWIHLAAVVVGLLVMSQTRSTNWLMTATSGVAVFFSSAMVAHRTLYEARPGTSHLTEFYLWMSLGGALGGLFAALVAPKIFTEVYEYALLVALTMACRPGALFVRKGDKEEWMMLWLLLAAGILLLWWMPWLAERFRFLAFGTWGPTFALTALFGLVLIASFHYPPRQLLMALLMGATVIWMPLRDRLRETSGDSARSYFGVYRVSEVNQSNGSYNILIHGTTLHGAQRVRDTDGKPVEDLTPATYYHPKSPMGLSVGIVRKRLADEGKKGRFGLIGLGSGSMPCHSARDDKDEHWRIFEIDPVMIKLTSKPSNFSFISKCAPDLHIHKSDGKTAPPQTGRIDLVIGDARLTMAKEPDNSFDLIVVDAFSSDAVPVHLMTREALEMYKAKTTEKGVAVLHVSNRYLDLEGVLSATAPLVPGYHGLIISDENADGSYAQSSSTVVVFSKSKEALEGFRKLGDKTADGEDKLAEVHELQDPKKMHAWTDDWSDILGPFRSRLRF